MPEFVTNLLRRGAGLAPAVSPRLPAVVEKPFELEEPETPELNTPAAADAMPQRDVASAPAALPREQAQKVEKVVTLREVQASPKLPVAGNVVAVPQPATVAGDRAPVPADRREVPPRAVIAAPVDHPAAASPARGYTPLLQPQAAPAPVIPVPLHRVEAPPAKEPAIEVRIGRIEIRQPAPPAPPQQLAPRRQPWVFGGNPLARRYLDRRWY